MTVARCAMLVPLLAAFALSGCHTRNDNKTVEQEELSAENQRLVGEVSRLQGERDSLAARLKNAEDELGKQRATPSIGEKFRDLAEGPEIEGTSRTERGGLALNEDFAFAKGSIELSAEGKKAIEKIAARLNSATHGGGMVIVEGHTDKSPVARASTKEKYIDNWGLSGARAAAVIRALQAAGVDPKRIKGQFRGEYQPRGTDEAANRRVEIFLGN
jgi:flagellar motor protein MotB